jgi:hypothetical protein
MSHGLDPSESPHDARLGLVDQYLFQGDQSTVLVMNSNRSMAGSQNGAPFDPGARYEFRILFDGDQHESLTYRVQFADLEPDGQQSYSLLRLSGADAADDNVDGALMATGRTNQTTTQAELAIWAGRARDPFFVDLSVLLAITSAIERHEVVLVDDRAPGHAINSFAASTVSTIVLALPHSDAEVRPGRDMALWTTSRLRRDTSGWHQISRQGLPMVGPLLRPTGSEIARLANTTHPSQDWTHFGGQIADEVAGVVLRHGTAADPEGYGAAVARRITPDVLPYTIGTSATFGFAGINGRTLRDNVAEVMFSLVTNRAIPTGLRPHGAATNEHAMPYVVPVAGDGLTS